MKRSLLLIALFSLISLTNCQQGNKETENSKLDFRTPVEIIDLGGLVTEDLPERVWGKALMPALGFNPSNKFEVIEWEFKSETGRISGSNAYYTIFNHGGPHIDAPSHMDAGGGLDSYALEVFMGPLKVFDVSNLPKGHTVAVKVFKDKVLPGDVVLIYTKYIPPQSDDSFPEVTTLTHEAILQSIIR